MGKRWWFLGLALVLAAGCCQNPGVFQKVQRSLETVQSYYSPLLAEEWQQDERLRRAVVAADTALLLAGELQGQWCPDAAKTEQLALQAKEARALAQDAGVKAAGAPSD
jgi:type II secretory pathway component PulM